MRLKELRKEQQLTQQDVANLLDCSTPVYSRYETGTRQPSIEVLVLLSSIFNVSVDYIIGNDKYASEFQSDKKESSFDLLILQAFHQADAFDQVAVCRLLGIDKEKEILKKAT